MTRKVTTTFALEVLSSQGKSTRPRQQVMLQLWEAICTGIFITGLTLSLCEASSFSKYSKLNLQRKYQIHNGTLVLENFKSLDPMPTQLKSTRRLTRIVPVSLWRLWSAACNGMFWAKKIVQSRIHCIYDIPVYFILRRHLEHLLIHKVLYLKFNCHSHQIYILAKLNIVIPILQWDLHRAHKTSWIIPNEVFPSGRGGVGNCLLRNKTLLEAAE